MNSFNPYALVAKLKSLSDDLDALEAQITALTPGEIIFPNSSNELDGDSNLFWDDTNKRQGIGTNTPERALEVKLTAASSGTIKYPLRITYKVE